MICIPSRVTEVEKKAVIDAASQAGARKVYLIEEPIAAAIGNHESKGKDYSYHFYNPNKKDAYGKTNSGCDYYFSLRKKGHCDIGECGNNSGFQKPVN